MIVERLYQSKLNDVTNLGDFHAVLGEHGVVEAHKTRLADGSGRSRFDSHRFGVVVMLL